MIPSRMIPYITAAGRQALRIGLIPKILTDSVRRGPQNMWEPVAGHSANETTGGLAARTRKGTALNWRASLMSTLRGFTAHSTFHTGTPVPDPFVPIKAAQRCRIIIVDDDQDYRCALRMHLANEGFDVIECSGGLTALEMTAAYETANVILLDWRMPDMNGLEVLCELRRRAIATPVIFLTGVADETIEEAALAAGAADFIQKSRGLSVLERRIELAAEGRRPSSQPPTFRLGPLQLRFDISRAFWRGSEIDLTLTEFRMVSKLALEAGHDVAYRELYDLVHGKDFVTGYNGVGHFTNMRTFIKRIRRKFQAIDASFSCIKTREGYGYCWIDQ